MPIRTSDEHNPPAFGWTEWQPRTPDALYAELAERVSPLPDRARVLLDGPGAVSIADGVLPALRAAGRLPLRVSGADFLRPAGERYTYGREDPDAFWKDWLDAGALRREVLDSKNTFLPALWDADRDRSARARRLPLPARGVLLVDGLFLLGRGLPAAFVVHVTVSAAALRRRGVPAWQLPAFTDYEQAVRPADHCDVLVRAEDPLRPAIRTRADR